MRTRVLGHWGFMATLAVVAIIGVACSGDDSGNSSAGPTAPSAADLEQGGDLYLTSCGWCHGYDLRGTERAPSHLSALYGPDSTPDAAFRSAIANGLTQKNWTFGDMAPVAGLTTDEVDLIITYVRHMQATEGLEPYPPGG